MTYHIRWMTRMGMPDVLEIEGLSFDDRAWTEEDFLRCLRQRNCIGMVAERGGYGGKVAGFMIYEIHKSRLHIVNLAVHPQFRLAGVGRAMVDKLVSKLSSHRRNRITLEVHETNLPAQKFFRAVGFQATGVLRGFYEDDGADAYRMVRRVAVPAGSVN